jgi:peptide/nickel transport system permease protein
MNAVDNARTKNTLGNTKRILRFGWSFRIGAMLCGFLVMFAVFGPWLSPYDPYASDEALLIATNLPAHAGAPSLHHWLGLDQLFRDQFVRLAHGARLSLMIGTVSSILALALGTAVGVWLGYFAPRPEDERIGLQGRLTRFALSMMDILLSIPFMLLVMMVATLAERSSATLVTLVLGLTGWLGTARLVRTETLRLRNLDFVGASLALGQSHFQVLWRHIVPNLSGILTTTVTFGIAQMILAESALAYLGASVAPPEPTWGYMLSEGKEHMHDAPWLLWAPGVLLVLAVLGFNLLGDGLRQAQRTSEGAS